MVRVIEYRLQDAAGEVTEIFALITTRYRGGPIASWAGDPAYAVFDAGYSADFVLP